MEFERFEVPAVHALHIGEIVRRFGVDSHALFSSLGLEEKVLAGPENRVELETFIALWERARALTEEPGLGILAGLQMRVSAHGFLGFAALTASTLGDALELASLYSPTRSNAFGLVTRRHDDEVHLVLRENANLGSARDMIVLSMLVGLWQMGNALTGRVLTGRAELAFARPAYLDRFDKEVPATLVFSRPQHALVFSADLLSLPLVLADPIGQKLAREQCERALEKLSDPKRTAMRIRSVFENSDGEWPQLEDVARALALSPRTLKRRLRDEGTSFQALLDEQRCERARRLLEDRSRSVESVAFMLGYCDAANFTRAFRRWVGMSPRHFRDGLASSL
jgi:AraC-like DNA-binding protein